MTDLELEEQRLLAAARRELSPDAEAMARVRAATERALCSPPSTPTSDAPAHAGPLDVLWRAPGLFTRALAAAVLSASAGLVGYGLGAQSARPGAIATFTPPVVVSAALPVPSAAPTRQAAAEHAAADALESAAADALEPAAAAARVPQTHAARGRNRSSSARAAEDEPRDPLQLELSMVKRVESELRVGNPSQALLLLRELDRQVPDGQLHEERSAADAIARCALGLGNGRAHGEAFVARFAHSAYVARVRQHCEQAPR